MEEIYQTALGVSCLFHIIVNYQSVFSYNVNHVKHISKLGFQLLLYGTQTIVSDYPYLSLVNFKKALYIVNTALNNPALFSSAQYFLEAGTLTPKFSSCVSLPLYWKYAQHKLSISNILYRVPSSGKEIAGVFSVNYKPKVAALSSPLTAAHH